MFLKWSINPGDSLKAAPCIKATREAEQMFDYWVTSKVSTFDNLNKTQISFTKQFCCFKAQTRATGQILWSSAVSRQSVYLINHHFLRLRLNREACAAGGFWDAPGTWMEDKKVYFLPSLGQKLHWSHLPRRHWENWVIGCETGVDFQLRAFESRWNWCYRSLVFFKDRGIRARFLAVFRASGDPQRVL